MEQGFFINIKKLRRKNTVDSDSFIWEATSAEQVVGWGVSKVATIEDAIVEQRRLYREKCARSEQAPKLVKSRDAPMAQGMMTRFVEVYTD